MTAGDVQWDLTPEQLEAVAEVLFDHDERIAREAAAAERPETKPA